MKSKEEVEKLLSRLKEKGYDRRRIEEETDYSSGYIDQALSRNKVSDKFYNRAVKLLRKEYPEDLYTDSRDIIVSNFEPETNVFKDVLKRLEKDQQSEIIDLGKAVKEIRAICDVLLIASAEILAKDRPGDMASSYREQFEKMVNDRLAEKES